MLTAIELLDWPFPLPRESVVVCAVYIGEPFPKERPRVVRGGVAYTPERTKKYEKALRNLFLAETKLADPDGASRFGVRCRFYRSTRRRVDLDNLQKAVLDSANKAVWLDDTQVEESHATKHHDRNNPRAEIVIYRLER